MVFHICLVSNFAHVIIGICMRYQNKYMCALEKWTKSPNLSVHISFYVSCVYLCVSVCFGYYETDIAMTCGIFFSRKVNVYTFFVEIELSFDWFANDDEKDCVWYDLEVFTSNKYIDWFKCILFSHRLYTTDWWKKKLCSRHHGSCQKSINIYRSQCQYVLRICKYTYLLHSFKNSGFLIISMNLVSKQLSNVNWLIPRGYW